MAQKQKSTFLGTEVSQNQLAIPMWESVLRNIEFSRIIELGTWRGDFSVYFLMFCIQREAEFYTYDIVRRRRTRVKQLLEFDKCHRVRDIFKHKQEIIELIQRPGRTILFCDNGDKQREVDTFAPHLKSRDIIAVHDWMTEVFPDSTTEKLIDLFPDPWDGITKFFMKP